MGKMQYPNTQTHWKNEMCPPRSFVLIVTTKEPPHMIKKSTPNDFPLSSDSTPRFMILYYGTALQREQQTKDKWSPQIP